MNFNGLLEELKDIPIRNVLYHGTNGKRLFHILYSGKLKPRYYSTSLTDKPEIAVGRKAMITSKERPSSNIGGVLIHIFKDRIIGSKENRGVRTKPIAEFPVTFLKRFEKYKKIFTKEQMKFLNDLYKKDDRYFYRHEDWGDESNEVFKKLKSFNISPSIIIDYFNQLHDLNNSVYIREKEERLYFKKEKTIGDNDLLGSTLEAFKERKFGIDAKPIFMKIEIVDTPDDVAYRMMDEAIFTKDNYFNIKDFSDDILSKNKKEKKEILKNLIQLIKSKEDLFIKNDNYKIFLKNIEDSYDEL